MQDTAIRCFKTSLSKKLDFYPTRKILLWHDVIHSVSPNHNNNGIPCPIQEFLDILIILKPVLKAVVCTPQDWTQDLKTQLISTGVLILDAKKDLISTKKATFFYRQELAEVHPDEEIGANLLITVINRPHDFSKLIRTRKGKNGKPTSYHLTEVSFNLISENLFGSEI